MLQPELYLLHLKAWWKKTNVRFKGEQKWAFWFWICDSHLGYRPSLLCNVWLMKEEEQESSSSHNSNSPVAPEPGEMFPISRPNRQFQELGEFQWLLTRSWELQSACTFSIFCLLIHSEKFKKKKINKKEECAYFCYLQYTWSLSQLPSGERWGKILQGKIERNAKKKT